MASLGTAREGVDFEVVGFIGRDSEKFRLTGEMRKPEVGELFIFSGEAGINGPKIARKLSEDALSESTDVREIVEEIMAKKQYKAQWYESEESLNTRYAVTDDESKWSNSEALRSKKVAIKQAEEWADDESGDCYRTCRVIEYVDDEASTVVWHSNWENSDHEEKNEVTGQGGSGLNGETVKLLVWMHRDEGPPDHWDWLEMFGDCSIHSNKWDLVYGREVDTQGRDIRWSIRLNIYDRGNGSPVAEWDWPTFLRISHEEAWKVEMVLANDIPPREFPSHMQTANCYHCDKKVPLANSWKSYDSDGDMQRFCSCFCIDEYEEQNGGGERGYQYRIDPDGEEYEDPGCVWLRETNRVA